jgi:SAM-dependent methyltransferase
MAKGSGHQNSCRKAHWEKVFAEKAPNEVSWYQARPEISLAMIQATGAGKEARIIDVGGGASAHVDYLLDTGYRYVTVLDISGGAIRMARRRLGERANTVAWLERDITLGPLGQKFNIWHDRAVFHFLTDAEDLDRYLATLNDTLSPGGQLIIATFAPDGPRRCSGLKTKRYSVQDLCETLGQDYSLQETISEAHKTPSGAIQHFIYCRFLRFASDASA